MSYPEIEAIHNIVSSPKWTNTKYYKGICTSESTSDKPYITVKYFYNGVKGARNEPYTYEPNINCIGYAFDVSYDAAIRFRKNIKDFENYKNLSVSEA